MFEFHGIYSIVWKTRIKVGSLQYLSAFLKLWVILLQQVNANIASELLLCVFMIKYDNDRQK